MQLRHGIALAAFLCCAAACSRASSGARAIDPASGRVTGWIDASGLLAPSERPGTDALNGIAHLGERDRFLLTGKNWPKLFEVVFEKVQP